MMRKKRNDKDKTLIKYMISTEESPSSAVDLSTKMR